MVEWQHIELVLLDMDGTLLDLHFDTQFWRVHMPRAYAARHKLDGRQAAAEISPRLRQAEGTLNWYCLDHWSREFDLDILALKHEIAHLITFRPQAREFLSALRRRRIPVLLVTNAHAESLRLKLRRTRLDQFMNGIISAHDVAAAKETQPFWQLLQQRFGFDPDASLLIDDSPGVLRAARDFGIHRLLLVERPDSQCPAQPAGDFNTLGSFSQLLPGLQDSAPGTHTRSKHKS